MTAGRAGALLSASGGLGAKARELAPFVEWSWDGESLSAQNDRFGFQPAYYWATDDEIMLSPSIPALLRLGASADTDYRALATMLTFSFFIGDDTPFKQIRALPPAARLTWSPGKFTLTSAPSTVAAKPVGYREALAQYDTLFRAAVARRLPAKEFAMPLSGGRDSRHILLELHRAKARPKFCVTVKQYPPTASDDSRIAKLLAERLGLGHRDIEAPTDHFAAEMASLGRCSFNAIGLSQWSVVVDLCRAQGIDTVYDGLGGDFLSAGAQLTPDKLRLLDAGRLEDVARACMQDGHAFRQSFVKPTVRERLALEAGIERFAQELGNHLGAGNPLTSFLFYNRCRRRIAQNPLANFDEIATVHLPYLDDELVGFLLSLPASLLVGHSFHTDTIHAAFPQYRDIPFEKDWTLAGDARHFMRLSRDILRHVAGNPRSAFLRLAPLSARYALAAVLPAMADQAAWSTPWVVYFLALEDALRRRRA